MPMTWLFTSFLQSSLYYSSPDFAYEELVEQETQGEEEQAQDEGGDEHPAHHFQGERVPVGINAVAAEELHLDVIPGHFHHAVAKVELGEDVEGVAQLLVEILDGL